MPHTKQPISNKPSHPVILNLIENRSKNILPISLLHSWRGVRGEVRAFTLVELIVVIVILAILATIAFLSFNSYSSSSRDSVRLSDVNSIKKSLELYNVTGGAGYPIPDSYTGVTFSGGILWYQGFLGNQTAEILGTNLSKKPIDPLYNNEYTYSLLGNKREYQIKANLESGKMGYNDINSDSLAGNFDFNIFKDTKAASNSGTTCYINGNFNGLVGNTKDSSLTNYILAIPSIILTDPTSSSNTTFTGGNLSKMGSGILQCNGQSSPCIVTYNSSNVIYTGIPANVADLDFIMKNLDNAYSGSNITNLTNISDVINGQPAELRNIGAGLLKNNLGLSNLQINPIDGQTVLLMHLDGNIYNYGTNTSNITNNGVTFTGGGIFGKQASSFNGTNSYLVVNDSDDLHFGTGDFTIDAWIKLNNLNTQEVLSQRTDSNNYYSFHYNSTYGLRFAIWNGGSNTVSIDQGGNSGWATGQWYHVAITRNGNTWKIYRNGIPLNTITSPNTHPNYTGTLRIGQYPNGTEFLNGFLSELRIVKGKSIWTSNFTPPTSPY